MPTPLQLLLDPVSLVVFAIFGGLMLWEALAPARPLPHVRGWKLRGIASFFVFFFASSYLPLLWGEYLAPLQLLDLSALPVWAAAVIGVLAYEIGVYVWHRTMHSSNALFRAFHQMHHSAERHDTFGAFWFSPLDMVGWTALSSLTLTLAGIPAQATVWVLYVTTFLAIFQHANVRTPRWLGYLVQRPESHSVHHQSGVHYYNFSDLPVLDLLFGTFRNPERFAPEQGYYPGASSRVLDMVLLRDVTTPRGAHGRS